MFVPARRQILAMVARRKPSSAKTSAAASSRRCLVSLERVVLIFQSDI